MKTELFLSETKRDFPQTATAVRAQFVAQLTRAYVGATRLCGTAAFPISGPPESTCTRVLAEIILIPNKSRIIFRLEHRELTS